MRSLQQTRAIPAALATVFAIFALTGGGATAQSDFGDAPDGTLTEYPGMPPLSGAFPTVEFTSNTRFPGNVGVEHIVTDVIWLGGAASVTTLEAVPNLTDLDVDDSGAFWWIALTGIPAGASLDVPVTLDPGAPPGPYYLNVLVDQNNDGEWRDVPGVVREWVVVDRVIDQAPGTTLRHGVPVPWSSSLLILPKWARITVSNVPLQPLMIWGPEGWDGSVPPGFPPALAVGARPRTASSAPSIRGPRVRAGDRHPVPRAAAYRAARAAARTARASPARCRTPPAAPA